LDRVEEIESEIKQDFTNDGPFCVKRLAKKSGQKPEAKKSLKFGGSKRKQQSIAMCHVRSEGWSWCLSFCKLFSASRFTFGAVSPIAPVATFPTRGFLVPNGLLQDAFRRKL